MKNISKVLFGAVVVVLSCSINQVNGFWGYGKGQTPPKTALQAIEDIASSTRPNIDAETLVQKGILKADQANVFAQLASGEMTPDQALQKGITQEQLDVFRKNARFALSTTPEEAEKMQEQYELRLSVERKLSPGFVAKEEARKKIMDVLIQEFTNTSEKIRKAQDDPIEKASLEAAQQELKKLLWALGVSTMGGREERGEWRKPSFWTADANYASKFGYKASPIPKHLEPHPLQPTFTSKVAQRFLAKGHEEQSQFE